MTNEKMTEIGNRIKNLRKERNLSQEEVAKQLDVSRQAVTRWENGRTLPSSSHVLTLAELFGVSVESLTGEIETTGVKSVKNEENATKAVLTLEELKTEIRTELKRCSWAFWAFLLTVLFFVVCWFFDIHLGWHIYAWYYIERYYYVWTACFFVVMGGVLQKKRFVASIFSGCVLAVLAGQLIAIYTRSHSPLHFNKSWMAVIVFWNLAFIAGLWLEYRAKKAPRKLKTRVGLISVVLTFAVVSFWGFHSKYTYSKGAEDGYLAGYETGLQDAKTGEDTRAEQYLEDCIEYGDKYNISTSIMGTVRHKGFFQYWESGYNAGYR